MPKDSAAAADAVNTPQRKPKRSSKNGIWNHAGVAVLISAAGVICAGVLLYWQLVITANKDYGASQIQLLNSGYVAYFNGKMDEIRVQMDAAATAEATVAALVGNRPDVIAARTAALTDQIGYAKRVDIIPLGDAQVDLDDEHPISYAMLDLIKRAETREFVGPEISKNQQNAVYAARPIHHNGVAEGVLFVVFDTAEFLKNPVARNLDGKVGRATILQTLDSGGSDNLDVFSVGDPGRGIETITTPLNAPHWQLRFTPNPQSIKPVNNMSELLAGLAVVFGFVLAGISLAFSSLSRKLQNDADQLSSFASSLIRGHGAQLERYRLPIFQQLAAGLSQLRRDREPEPEPGTAPAAKRGAPAAKGGAPAAKGGAPAAIGGASAAKAAAKKTPEPATTAALLEESDDFLEVALADDSEENFGIEVSEEATPKDLGLVLEPEIFRAYDIRGITTRNLTEEVVYWIGRAFAAEALDAEQSRVAVGRDGRHSSTPLRDALIRGLTEGGIDVLDIGIVPTPLLYFATHAMDTGTGIMITGSHNPPEYNGLKMMIGGVTLAEERIQALRIRLEENRLSGGEGDVEEIDLDDHYLDRVLEDVAVAQPLKVVVDCGNGVAGKIAPRLIEELGCDVVPLYCDIDGDFPNHHPDPAEPENLRDLIDVVRDEKADIGLAFDGDGDRLGVVTAGGTIIWPDKLLMLFAQDIVGRNPGADIIYDVKCSRHLNNLISDLGGRPIMWRTGHSHMKAKLKETGAMLAGEFSGHICFGERWFGFDDALYSAARLLEILGSQSKSADEVFEQFPVTYSTPEIKIETTEQKKFSIVEKLASAANFEDGAVTDIDGVRVDFPKGWGLIRASNTSPVLSLRFEADEEAELDRIKSIFQKQLTDIDSTLKIG